MAIGARATIGKGTQLNGIYEIDEPLATGGMGEIFRAHAIQTGDAVAIKLIRDDLAEDESALALFRREASALHSIHHEAIVRYFVFSIDPILQRPYLAMEFVEGQPLGDLLAEGPLPLADVMALKERVASGLHSAHQAGIIHRDIAPDNILVRNRDFSTARIIDFGIARSTRVGEATVIGSGFAGKFNYVSPEQLGLYEGEVTARTDMYSLGLVLAFACRGKRLDMGGSQVEVIEKRRKIPDLTGVYPEIRPLLARMLNPDPALRPATMKEIAQWRPAVEEASERTVVRLRPDGAKDRAATPPRDEAARPGSRLALWGGVAAALAVAAGLGVVLLGRPGAPRPDKPEIAAPSPTLEKPPETRPEPPAPTAPQPDARPSAPKLEPTPSGAALPGADASPAARMLDFMSHFNLGGCAFLAPVTVEPGAARIDGFGLDAKPFEAFDRAFTQAFRLEADISVREITKPQCPAADFMARFGAGGEGAPKLTLRAARIRSGEALSGALASEQPNVELVIVDDEGRAYNVTAQVRAGGASRSFAMRLQKPAAAQARPMLLIAVASAAPLKALTFAGGQPAETLFGALADETAGRSGVTATAAYFQIE